MYNSISVSWKISLNALENLTTKNNLIVATDTSIKILRKLLPSDVLIKSEILIRKSGYPHVEEIQNLKTSSNLTSHFDNLICIGGGATLDFGKLIVSDLPNFGTVFNITKLVLIPTNIGSGAEVTRFSTLWDYRLKLKKSILLPEIIERQVYYLEAPLRGLTNDQIEIGVLDTLGHLFDSLFSNASNPLIRLTAKQNIFAVCQILNSYYKHISPLTEKLIELQVLSSLGGMCIDQTKSSISHAFSYGLTLEFGIAHGYSVAFMIHLAIKKFKPNLVSVYPDCLETVEVIEETLRAAKLNLKIPEIDSLISVNLDKLVSQVDKVRLSNFIIPVDSAEFKGFFLTS
jgi:alcohol dehydrogenase class IV